MGRKKTLIFFLLFTLIFCTFYHSTVYAQDNPPQIAAVSGVILDYDTGQILYSKNPDQKVYPASTTKVLTAILALENGNLNDEVTAGKDATGIEGTCIYLAEGETLTLRQLLYAMLLPSANDAAIDIAEHIAGSIQNFAVMMNKKAAEIGATHSHFVNPNGLPDNNHYTTAYDMAKIASYAMKNPTFRQIVDTVTYDIPPTNKFKETRHLLSTNELIRPTSNHYDGADGIKTGYTMEANRCLIATAQKNNRRVIVALYSDDDSKIWTDATNLLNYGLNSFQNKLLISKGDLIKKLPLPNSSKTVNLYAKDDFNYTLPAEANGVADDAVGKNITYDKITAPIKIGQTLGSLNLTFDGKTIGKVALISKQSIKPDLSYTIKQKSNVFINVLIKCVLVLFIVSAIFMWIKSRKLKKIRSTRIFFK